MTKKNIEENIKIKNFYKKQIFQIIILLYII